MLFSSAEGTQAIDRGRGNHNPAYTLFPINFDVEFEDSVVLDDSDKDASGSPRAIFSKADYYLAKPVGKNQQSIIQVLSKNYPSVLNDMSSNNEISTRRSE